MATSSAVLNLPVDLPELPGGWDYAPLSRLVDDSRGISYGIVQPGSHADDGVPIVRVNNIRRGRIATEDVLRVQPEIEANYERSRLRGGEVLLTLVGSLGESAIVPEELAGWNAARAVGIIPVIDAVGPRWVELCLRSALIQHYIRIWATTTVQATFNLRDLARLPIPMPPEKERRAITCILGALDDKIDLNRRRNRTLEAMARAIFKSWFVDFDPVKIKAAGQTPPGLKPEITSFFPNAFEDSELGEIPKGWRVGTLGEVAENPRRGIAANAIAAGTAYIALEHMPRRSIALVDWSDGAVIESNKFEFRQGEILFGKLRPYFHKVGIAPINGVCSTDILVIVPKRSDWFGFAACHLSSDEIIQHADRASTGTKMPRTNWSDLARFQVVVPPVDLARVFAGQFKAMVDRIQRGIEESRTLGAMRDALLPKLISGELRLPDVERIVGRAT